MAVSIKDIARLAGVSQATVSRVLTGTTNVTPEKRQRVMEWVAKTGYAPSAPARELAGARSYLLGVLLPEISNPFFAEILGRVEEEASLRGYNVIVSTTRGNRAREASKAFMARRVDGLLVCVEPREVSALRALTEAGIPAVSVTQEVPSMDSAFVSMEKGGSLVARHLVDLGHERIAFVGDGRDPKFAGFSSYLEGKGIAFDPDLHHDVGDWESVKADALRAGIARFVERKGRAMSAVFAYNDVAALYVLHALAGAGLSVPEDVAVAGYDDTFMARELTPALTSVAQPTGELGRIAVESLVARIEGVEAGPPRRMVLGPRLVVRESTRGRT